MNYLKLGRQQKSSHLLSGLDEDSLNHVLWHEQAKKPQLFYWVIKWSATLNLEAGE